MVLDGPNPKLLLVAHQKGFLHSFSLFGFGAALYMGCFPNTTPTKVSILHCIALHCVGGAWSVISQQLTSYSHHNTDRKANTCFWLLAGGAWVSLVGDTWAAFLNESLPLGAEKTGATPNPDGLCATVLKLSAMAMGIGSVMLCAGVNAAGLLGKAKAK